MIVVLAVIDSLEKCPVPCPVSDSAKTCILVHFRSGTDYFIAEIVNAGTLAKKSSEVNLSLGKMVQEEDLNPCLSVE